MNARTLPLVGLYIAAITAANLLVAAFGPAVSPFNAFFLIGLDLSLRDRLHDLWAGQHLWPRMLGMILLAGGVSWVLNPAAGMIAIASAVAFSVAGAVDAASYQMLRRRPYLQRSNGSNAAGALADSMIFPTLAFGAFLPDVIALQFIAKLTGGAFWAWMIQRLSRATPR
jgi:hypothetical protein